MTTLTKTTPRIYVACLAAYNDGYLHGKWIDATDAYEMRAEIKVILAESPSADAEEWAIHDYELCGIKISEYENIDHVAEIAEALTNADNPELLAELYNHLGCSCISEALEYMGDHYHGEFDDLEAYAIDFIEQTGDLDKLPKYLQYYFDYAAFGRDCELGGDIFTIQLNGMLHVFNNM